MTNLKLGGFNCQGIKDKIEDPCFVKEVSKFDILGVCETWLNKNNENLNIPNYKFYPLSRKKEKDVSRGGVGLFIKESLRKHIKILYKISSENIFFCKLDKSYFNFNEDLYVGVIYFPPENSSREKKMKFDHFKNLLDVVSKIDSKNIILIGDFNARTGSLDDIILDEQHNLAYDRSTNTIKIKRNNHDIKINKHGKKLIDYCIESSSFIANGRTLGDLQGKYTCYQHNGTSTVDYAVISETLSRYVKTFMVSSPMHKSDHCMLELNITLPEPSISMNNNIPQKGNPPLKWNSKIEKHFKSNMESPTTIKLINEIENYFTSDEKISNDDILDKINFIYTYNAPNYKKKRNINVQHKNWYDGSCYQLNRKIKYLAKLNEKNPKNNDIRRNMNKAKQQYKKLLKDKKRKWREKLIANLMNLETKDPNQYWKIIGELRNESYNNKFCQDPDRFENFYKILFSKFSNKENSRQDRISKVIILKSLILHLMSLKNQ